MNKDEVKGKVKQAEGKTEAAYGAATDNPGDEVKGKVKEAAGAVQEGFGKAKEAIKKAVD